MAKLSADGKYVTVERGDTLSSIARDYGKGATYQQLAAINDISNANLIYVGQKIYLTKDGGGDSDSPSSSSSTATVKQFGYQSNSDGTLFATWTWTKSNTENYEVEWAYDTGDDVWFIGSKTTTEDKQSTYSIPSNAKRVRFRVKPISKTYTSNNKTVSYWTAKWSTAKTCTVSKVTPPSKPPVPTVEIDKYTLTASLDNLDVNATHIQFKIVKNDKTTFKKSRVEIVTTSASYSCTVSAGAEYKVACRSYNGSEYSDWSDYSENVSPVPSAPSKITVCRASSSTSVYLEWTKVTGAKSYTVAYTTKKEYFDYPDQVQKTEGITVTSYEKPDLESGKEYFFRVCAVNDQGESGWSSIKSVVLGKAPSAPTTWSSSTSVIIGEDLTLYWIHNSEDGSSEVEAELELTFNNGTRSITSIVKSEDEDEKDKTSFRKIKTSKYTDGTVIKWRVRTKGVLDAWSAYSVERTVDVYAPVTLSVSLLNVRNDVSSSIDVVRSFPVYIYTEAGSSNQLPIGYHVSIVSNEVYESVDRVGNNVTISAGQEVYSRYTNVLTDIPLVELSAGNIDLENNISYTINCTVSLNSGLTAEASIPFTVSWTDVSYEPNAEISLDKETYVTHIRPFCREYKHLYYQVTRSGSRYIKSSTVLKRVHGFDVKGAKTTTGEQVYSGVTSDGEEVYYCSAETSVLVNGVTLSVYRREFDGRFTELATGLKNSKNTFITDPHPALDYARYRIVATTDATGAVSYCDLPGYPVGGIAAIIQWDEAWSYFDATGEDALEAPAWAGSMLKLPYNIDVSDSGAPDVELVEYIGREHPVSYYGTQRGFTSTWNVDIEADDEETLYAIRRLQNWMGNAYVREPSGSGYWANVKVSFSQKHRELTIPVTFTITRVEGGV